VYALKTLDKTGQNWTKVDKSDYFPKVPRSRSLSCQAVRVLPSSLAGLIAPLVDPWVSPADFIASGKLALDILEYLF
jgi:hypothetical protein